VTIGGRGWGLLDLEACRIIRDIGLNNCHFDTAPVLNSSVIERLFLDGSALPGLHAERLEARGAVATGVAVPLKRVIPMVRQAVPGRVLNVDLEQVAGGGWVYKLLVLDGQGKYSEVYVDALRNRIVKVRER